MNQEFLNAKYKKFTAGTDNDATLLTLMGTPNIPTSTGGTVITTEEQNFTFLPKLNGRVMIEATLSNGDTWRHDLQIIVNNDKGETVLSESFRVTNGNAETESFYFNVYAFCKHTITLKLTSSVTNAGTVKALATIKGTIVDNYDMYIKII